MRTTFVFGGLSLRRFSSASAASIPLRELQNASIKDAGKLLNVTGDEFKGILPEVKENSEIWSAIFGSNKLLLRPGYFKVFERIKGNTRSAYDSSLMYIDGERGTGKSILLALSALLARQMGYLTIYIPNSRHLVIEKYALETGTGTAQAVVRSTQAGFEDMFAQPFAAQEILSNLVDLHGDILKKLKQKRKYEHALYRRKIMQDGQPEVDESLMTIAMRGQKDMIYAANALYDLRLELSMLSEQDGVKVAVIVDEFNTLYWPSCYYAKGEHIPTHKLLVPQTFRSFDPTSETAKVRDELKLKSGFTLLAPTKRHVVPFHGRKELLDKKTFYPNPENVYFPYAMDSELVVQPPEIDRASLKRFTFDEFETLYKIAAAESKNKTKQAQKNGSYAKYNLENLAAFYGDDVKGEYSRDQFLHSHPKMIAAVTARNPELVQQKLKQL